ncbi:MAG: anti-sigma factor, partial [Xylophilus ampelinus]
MGPPRRRRGRAHSGPGGGARAGPAGAAAPGDGAVARRGLRRGAGHRRRERVAVAVGTGLERQLAQRDRALAEADRGREALAAQLRAAPQVAYVAVLSDARAVQTVLVTIDPGRNALTVRRVGDFHEGPDRSLQLWALPPGGAPQSLGVLGDAPVLRLGNGAEAARAPALAISLEPLGGAPAGSGPTGPVLFQAGCWTRPPDPGRRRPRS